MVRIKVDNEVNGPLTEIQRPFAMRQIHFVCSRLFLVLNSAIQHAQAQSALFKFEG